MIRKTIFIYGLLCLSLNTVLIASEKNNTILLENIFNTTTFFGNKIDAEEPEPIRQMAVNSMYTYLLTYKGLVYRTQTVNNFAEAQFTLLPIKNVATIALYPEEDTRNTSNFIYAEQGFLKDQVVHFNTETASSKASQKLITQHNSTIYKIGTLWDTKKQYSIIISASEFPNIQINRPNGAKYTPSSLKGYWLLSVHNDTLIYYIKQDRQSFAVETFNKIMNDKPDNYKIGIIPNVSAVQNISMIQDNKTPLYIKDEDNNDLIIDNRCYQNTGALESNARPTVTTFRDSNIDSVVVFGYTFAQESNRTSSQNFLLTNTYSENNINFESKRKEIFENSNSYNKKQIALYVINKVLLFDNSKAINFFTLTDITENKAAKKSWSNMDNFSQKLQAEMQKTYSASYEAQAHLKYPRNSEEEINYNKTISGLTYALRPIQEEYEHFNNIQSSYVDYKNNTLYYIIGSQYSYRSNRKYWKNLELKQIKISDHLEKVKTARDTYESEIQQKK